MDLNFDNDKAMTIIEHLEELRHRLIIMLAAVGVTTTGCWFLSIRAIKLLMTLTSGKLQVLGPSDALLERLKISAIMGLMVAVPVVLWQIWLFVAPGLKSNEKKYVFPIVSSGVALFYIGAAFAALMIPYSIKFLEHFGGGVVQFNYTLDRFISFATTIIFTFGIVFQFPLVLFFLAKIGVVSYKTLAASRRYAIVLSVAVGALITPDPMTNLMVTLPLYVLFEISLLVVRFTQPHPATSDR